MPWRPNRNPACFAGHPVVRYYVAKYSAAAAETWARSKGATEAEIEVARRCLTNAPVTAQAKTQQTFTAGWAGQ